MRDAGPLAGRGEVEMFCARKGHVTAWHSDFQENFTIQLRGRKRWRLAHRREAHPLRGETPHFADDSVLWDQAKARALGETIQSRKRPRAAPGVEEVVLEAGDVLYFPAGVFHEVESLDDDNISLNVSLMAPTTAVHSTARVMATTRRAVSGSLSSNGDRRTMTTMMVRPETASA